MAAQTELCCLSELIRRFNMRRYWLKFAIAICAISLIGLSLFAVYTYRLFYRPMIGATNEPVVVNIDKSMSAYSFAHMLKARRLIQS